jgi:Flavodoxin
MVVRPFDPKGAMMKAVVVFESMYGNTHVVADHIADGLRTQFETVVVPVGEATEELVTDAALLVVGGPTHVHGMTSSMSRKSAIEAATKDDDLELDPDAEGPGLRDWFHRRSRSTGRHGVGAAFDTRLKASPLVTGRASKGIAKRLHQHGYELVVEPESFLVDDQNHLIDGEAERACSWGESVASSLAAARGPR